MNMDEVGKYGMADGIRALKVVRQHAAERGNAGATKTLYIANSADEMIPGVMQRFADTLSKNAPATLRRHYERMPEESHATVYHPAALRAFRSLFKPDAGR